MAHFWDPFYLYHLLLQEEEALIYLSSMCIYNAEYISSFLYNNYTCKLKINQLIHVKQNCINSFILGAVCVIHIYEVINIHLQNILYIHTGGSYKYPSYTGNDPWPCRLVLLFPWRGEQIKSNILEFGGKVRN